MRPIGLGRLLKLRGRPEAAGVVPRNPIQKEPLPMPVRLSARCLLALLPALAASPAFAPLAGAATSNDPTQFAVTAGTLAFGTPAPDVPNLPGLTLNGQSQTLNAQMASFVTSDGTG